MNKRQAKKAFKKKYGVNPAQFDRALDHLTLTVQNIDWAAIGRGLAEAIQTTVKALTEALNNAADYIRSPEFQEALRKYKEKQEEEQMSKEDALEIGLAINAIATLLDDRNLAKVERYLKRIEEITLKYVQEENDESSNRTRKTDP